MALEFRNVGQIGRYSLEKNQNYSRKEILDILEDLNTKDISIKVEKLTNNYINIRKSHGELLLLENNLKKNINKKIKSNIKLQKGGTIVDNNNEL